MGEAEAVRAGYGELLRGSVAEREGLVSLCLPPLARAIKILFAEFNFAIDYQQQNCKVHRSSIYTTSAPLPSRISPSASLLTHQLPTPTIAIANHKPTTWPLHLRGPQSKALGRGIAHPIRR